MTVYENVPVSIPESVTNAPVTLVPYRRYKHGVKYSPGSTPSIVNNCWGILQIDNKAQCCIIRHEHYDIVQCYSISIRT